MPDRRKYDWLVGLALGLALWLPASGSGATDLPRVIVSTDLGGSDPDDYQSMVHYLVYADRFETEGLISSPPHDGRAEHLLECIDAYEADYANLRTWSANYPAPDALRDVVRQGAVDPQAAEAPSEDLSPGAALIIDRANTDNPRPLYVLVWGSITDIAQAVHHAPEIKPKLRVLSIGSWNTRQDRNARDYLFDQHPDLWWIESDSTFRGMYIGGEQAEDRGNTAFPEAHVAGHGALGALFMRMKPDIKMGDTPTVLYLLHGDADDPASPHWGGAYVRPDPEHRPTYWHDDPQPDHAEDRRRGARTVNAWRAEYLDDWSLRMDRVLAANPAGQDETE